MVPRLSFAQFERQLLKRSVGALAADRERCRECGRTPLVGEHIHIYASGRVACELCRDRRPEDPVACHPVRGAEYGHAVRLTH